MLMLVTQIGNMYQERVRNPVTRALTITEKEITVFDVLKAYVVCFIGSVFVIFFATIEPDKIKPRPKR